MKALIPIFWAALSLSWASAAPEKKVSAGVHYYVLTCEPAAVQIVWKNNEGKQLRTFQRAEKFLKSEGLKNFTLMNGGIFEPREIPSGLLLQKGKELNPVNRKEGSGNFFLKPNGIFLIGDQGARVIETSTYPLQDMAAQQAVQSGPLLLEKGVIHPKFRAQSKSRLHRNGVGVTKAGKVVFVMSDPQSPKFPNFYQFASLFQELGCENALFLDGNICQMKTGSQIAKAQGDYASFIAVSELAAKGD